RGDAERVVARGRDAHPRRDGGADRGGGEGTTCRSSRVTGYSGGTALSGCCPSSVADAPDAPDLGARPSGPGAGRGGRLARPVRRGGDRGGPVARRGGRSAARAGRGARPSDR